MSSSPIVSVVLPFYRNPLVREAVQSILDQTFRDFEIIAIDDASGNGVADLLKDISDPRLKVVVREENGGENATRNHGISLATGRYIAFQDHDDISYPDRLRLQVEFLESHPAVLGCGTACHYGDSKIVHSAPLEVRHLQWEMIFNNHVMFPTVMVRTDVARRYPFGNLVATDDYRWLFEVMREGDFVNIPEVTFHYRMQATSLSVLKAELQVRNLDLYRAKFAAVAGAVCSNEEIRFLSWLGTPRAEPWPLEDLAKAGPFLRRLVDSFVRTHPGDRAFPVQGALSRMRYACTVSSCHGAAVWAAWNSLRKSFGVPLSFDALKLAAKCFKGAIRRSGTTAG